MSEESAERGRGSVGHQIFDQVEALIASEGLTRSQAFQRISEQSGRRPQTVGANYYRVARQRGAQLQPRAPRGRRGQGDERAVSAALARAEEALRELAELVARQEHELAELRTQAAKYERVRNLVSSGT